MSLPPFLVAELRLTFKACARNPYRTCYRQLSSSRSLCKRQTSREQTKLTHTSKAAPQNQDGAPDTELETNGASRSVGNPSTNDIVPSDQDKRSVGRTRSVDVPMKIVPKADVTPALRLSPRERLHIEILTRRSPEKIVKKVYKEKLLIYHQGTGREKLIILMKFLFIFGFSANTAIVVPAMFTAGAPGLICAAALSCGFLPLTFFHSLTKTMVNRIYLHLPTKARESPQAAMEYARNLPITAMLDIEFIRPIPTAGIITAHVADLEPKTNWWRPTSFQWKKERADPGTILLPNPIQFYVKPDSSQGKAARFVVPRIWPNIFKKLTGQESTAVSKWKR